MARSDSEVSAMTFTKNKSARGRGFTLVELMITLAIIALLATIAFPVYRDQLLKSRRAEGKTALLKAIQLEERAYTSTGQYTSDLKTLFGAPTATVFSGEDASKGWYTLTAAAITDFATGVTVTATPAAPFDDPICGTLTLDSTGTRTFSGAKGTKDTCW
jgi:type IV pilus assembly protein PilE